MPPVRLGGPQASFAGGIVINAALLGYNAYELFRVYKCTHPVLSPKLAAHGLYPRPAATADDRIEEKPGEGWMKINGVLVLIPSYETVMRPFRRE
jgi:hypothetical protein